MNLNSNYLMAFYEVAKAQSFSKAAENLFVTQSAISQRIHALENDLESTLIIRNKNSISLTETGERLLQHAKTVFDLEEEFLENYQSTDEIKGTVRICAFSSVLRSLIIPKLSPFLRNNPGVQIEFISDEMVNIPEYLKSARADFIILDYHLNKSGINEIVLGQEEYVVIESKKFQCPKDIYLDHGPHDNATESFFFSQGKKDFKYRRTFMGDVYGIIDGVKQGLGRAVMSKHLVDNDLKIIKGYNAYRRDITLHYVESSYYTRLQKELIKALT